MTNRVMLEEVVQFQKLLDGRVKHLLNLTPDDLFDVGPVEPVQQPTETPSVYLACCRCGEQVLKSHIIVHRGETYCIPCFQRINTGCMRYSLQ